MKLYGSTTSPFARRLRIWLANEDHEFINLQIFSGEDRELLARHNPTLKIPMLADGEVVIFDSRVIFRYLVEKFDYPRLSWEQENQLTLIDAANDSLVQMLMLSRSEIDTAGDKMYFNIQRERVDGILQVLEDLLEEGHFDDWNYPAICLYCLIDWIEFRTLHELTEFNGLREFHARNNERIEATATDPRMTDS